MGIWEVVEESRVGKMLRDLNNTFIARIPKKEKIVLLMTLDRFPCVTLSIRSSLR